MSSICGCCTVDSLIGEHSYQFDPFSKSKETVDAPNSSQLIKDTLSAEQLCERLFACNTDASTALGAQPLLLYMKCVEEPKPVQLPHKSAEFLKSLKFDVSDEIFEHDNSAVWMKSVWQGAERMNFGLSLKLHATYYFNCAHRIAYIVVVPSVPKFLHFSVEFSSQITVVSSSSSSSSNRGNSGSSSSSSEATRINGNSFPDVVRIREVVKMNGRRLLLKFSLQQALNAHERMFNTWWQRIQQP